MNQVWVVIDVGCHECGVGSVEVGAFATRDEAQAAARARDDTTKCWRDGGQTFAEVFGPFDVPTSPSR